MPQVLSVSRSPQGFLFIGAADTTGEAGVLLRTQVKRCLPATVRDSFTETRRTRHPTWNDEDGRIAVRALCHQFQNGSLMQLIAKGETWAIYWADHAPHAVDEAMKACARHVNSGKH